MQIKIFTKEEEANNFIKEVEPISLEYHNYYIILIYQEIPSLEERKAKKIKEDEREAMYGLEEAKMQLVYLNLVSKQSDEMFNITKKSIETTEQNIKNYQSKLQAIALWKKE